jgi:tetratricopeptide (TPR) repeat protein
MARILAWLMSMTVALLVGGGCASPGQDGHRDESVRTVTADSERDTRAAREANRRGVSHLEAGRLQKAKAAFQKAITADGRFGPAQNNLGEVYYKQGQGYKAARRFDRARKLMPERPEPYNNLGLVLERGSKVDPGGNKLERAIDYYRKAVQRDPDNMEYLGNLTRALVRRGDDGKEVRRLLQRLLEEDDRPQWLMWAERQLSTMRDKNSG